MEEETTMVSAERTSAGSPRGESISIVYTERHFCVAVRRTYSMGERVLGRFSGSGEGCGITLGRPIYHFIFFLVGSLVNYGERAKEYVYWGGVGGIKKHLRE